ncbi:CP2 transcription factor-domain-containing protein [Absidia repens]|uniref:CP2 transcription factor-domain-containing protein n=1 Tax=Absidia repens TaxID=90262 RepID=A0A1X2IBP9_9FUNG|nr:CP2 transcription factor-domain-containing protein [Absidia repens]
MLASEHCTDSLYDSQYHSVKMANDYNFKQEPEELLLDDESSTTIANTTLTTTPSPQPSSGMISNQQTQQHLQHLPPSSWYQQQQHSTSGTSYSNDEIYYASLPPPPPAPPLFNFPSPLPKKKQLVNRNHPRHHSANGILQQYAHYHHQQPQQQHPITMHTLQRQPSSSTSNCGSSLPATYTVPSSSTTICTAANPQYSSTTSQSSSSPTESTLSSLSPTSTLKQTHHDGVLETSSPLSMPTTPLRYQISLQAATAAAQRFGEPSSLTYLNRGQAYGLHFQDQQYNNRTTPKNTIITSTISITFHDAAHRQASRNYWRFWLSQQDRPNEARALDLDTQQSSGLVNVHYPSFDRITIQWEPHAGATLFVRFNCLSTDFSRIKGVKGIPLRAYIETTADVATPSSSSSSSSSTSSTDGYEKYTEKSFCKIKLFRDKGAERKNKDDAKQISKQLEKLKAEKNPQHNPLWQFYNRPQLPYSVFEALPNEDDLVKAEFPMVSSAPITTVPIPPLPIPTVASNTAPSLPTFGLPQSSYSSTSPSLLSPSSSIISNTTISPSQPLAHNHSNYQILQQQHQQQQQQQHDNNMTIMSSFYPSTFSYPSHFVQPTHSTSPFVYNPVTSPSMTPSSLGYQQQQSSWSATSNVSPVLGMKRSRSHVMTPTLDQPSPPEDQPSTKKHRGATPALTLFVDKKNTSSSSSSPIERKEIKLETLTVHHLISKLSEVFKLQAQSVTEVLWRRDPTGTTTPSDQPHHVLELHQQKKSSSSHPSAASNVLVLVDENVLEHFPDRTVMAVQWEISASGTVRFILEF